MLTLILGSYFYFTFTLAYAIDSCMCRTQSSILLIHTLTYSVLIDTANTSEMLIAMCVGKQLISFAFGIYILEWVIQSGYVVIIAGVFCAVLFANNLLVIPFMIFGKQIRTIWAGTWLAKMHRKTVKQVMTH